MSEAAQITEAARIRAQLDHPLIDGDSHVIEYMPVLLDYVAQAGGQSAVERLTRGARGPSWYAMSEADRRAKRPMRGPWWALPTKNTLDRCTAMLPRLYHQRMDDFGIDVAVLYPTQGLFFAGSNHPEQRQVLCNAYNAYIADCYAEFGDRMIPAAVIPLHTPQEGIAELEHAASLGLKVAMIPSYIRRPVADVAERFPDMARQVTWLDSYGFDSEYDYDPFWAKCVELGFAVAAHSGGMGFDDRKSQNYMYNHMGHFAAAGEVLAKSLLMGGVTRRFPDLRVALLEGGVQNGVRLFVDTFSRWKKRSPAAGLANLDPANLDLPQAQALFEGYGDTATRDKLDRLEETLMIAPRQLTSELQDDFAAMQIETTQDLVDLFIPHFYFGCEADDPLACMAFDRRLNPAREQVRAIMSFDLGHWDVSNMDHAACEAYEQLEDGLVGPEDFRKFGFTHSVQLYAGANPKFFEGTRIEADVAAELATR